MQFCIVLLKDPWMSLVDVSSLASEISHTFLR